MESLVNERRVIDVTGSRCMVPVLGHNREAIYNCAVNIQ
jgi:TusA-related sulfurtransferase